MLSAEGDQSGFCLKWESPVQPDEAGYIVPSLFSSCLSQITFSQQILALATTKAYERNVFFLLYTLFEV